jgi:hypothetical protein
VELEVVANLRAESGTHSGSLAHKAGNTLEG